MMHYWHTDLFFLWSICQCLSDISSYSMFKFCQNKNTKNQFLLCFLLYWKRLVPWPHSYRGTYQTLNSVYCYTPTQWPPGIYVLRRRHDVQVCRCHDKCPTFNKTHLLWHWIKLAHSTCLTQLKNRRLLWHPELSPFLSSASLLVIIVLTLSVRQINQNDFFQS